MTPCEPLGSKGELLRYFSSACKQPQEFRIGAEFEKLGVDEHTGAALPFSGPCGVEATLKQLAAAFGWAPLYEGGHVVGLERHGGAHISLEPGAQLELSTTACRTLDEMAKELSTHIGELKEVSGPCGIAWLGLGMQPVSAWEQIEVIPKQRYAIMTRYMPRKGPLGLAMMRQTAAVQLNLDYCDEQDAMEKCRLSMLLSPVLMALYANSPVSDGRTNGFVSKRVFIWGHTDPDRCGLIEKLFSPGAGFEDYVEYALGVPMYFIVRDGRWIEIGGRVTFGRFLERGFEGHTPSWQDWTLHLNTVFTTVRFNPFLEIRGIDCPPPRLIMSVPAVVKGILYDAEARQAARSLVGSWTLAEIRALYDEVSRKGPHAVIRGRALKEIAPELVRISKRGLKNQRGTTPGEAPDETVYLEPLEELLECGSLCPALDILSHWEGDWNRDIRKLIAYARF